MGGLYTCLISKILPIIRVHTAHNTFKDKKFLTRLSLNKCNIVCVGQEVKRNLRDIFNISEENLQVIYNGVEDIPCEYQEIEEISYYKKQGFFIVGNVGRLSEQKGFYYYIEAAKLLYKENKNIKFFIIGDGGLREQLEQQIKKSGMEDVVILLGYRSDIKQVMNSCDLIVLSSLWEGLPLTPIEAFISKRTIVATNVDGTPEIVKNNINGILVEPKDSNQIKSAILQIYNNPSLKRELEDNAYKTYYEHFTIDKFIQNYKLYYENLIYN